MIEIYIDADACPVKSEAVRVAERHGLKVYMVSNTGTRQALGGNVQGIMVGREFDAADNWIVEHVQANDIVITSDILLASRCLELGCWVLGGNGKKFSKDNIGGALAMRALNAHLRETGESKGHNAAFTNRDRSQFLQAMEEIVQAAKRTL